ncbi:CDP-alcohol phosphatidyltransferase family protein [Patescibacteria group bacterium]|nr:CDP-alcohol phosphatidyltransferase family protein [Patescibacteria group bacterium]
MAAELVRKHQAITYRIEKKILDILAAKLYQSVTADQLSFLALCGAILASLAYILAGQSLWWLTVAGVGIFIHWFGDSLDGRTARLRGENRPLYGHYLDHILDAISVVIIVFGINFSDITNQSTWVWVLVLFLLLMIHSYLKASVTGVFELAIERYGGTEIRIGLILMNLLILATGNPSWRLTAVETWTLTDVLGGIIAALLMLNLIKAIERALWGRNRIRER